jgi:hypothetical protein
LKWESNRRSETPPGRTAMIRSLSARSATIRKEAETVTPEGPAEIIQGPIKGLTRASHGVRPAAEKPFPEPLAPQGVDQFKLVRLAPQPFFRIPAKDWAYFFNGGDRCLMEIIISVFPYLLRF